MGEQADDGGRRRRFYYVALETRPPPIGCSRRHGDAPLCSCTGHVTGGILRYLPLVPFFNPHDPLLISFLTRTFIGILPCTIGIYRLCIGLGKNTNSINSLQLPLAYTDLCIERKKRFNIKHIPYSSLFLSKYSFHKIPNISLSRNQLLQSFLLLLVQLSI